MQYNINLKANEWQRQEFQGTVLLVVDTGAAVSVDLDVELDGGIPVEELRDMKRGLRLRTPGFKSVRFRAPVDTLVVVVATRADIAINFADGNNVNANIIGTVPVNITAQGLTPIQVANDRGALGNPVYVSGLTYSDAPATAVNNLAAVAVTDAGAVLLAADADRKAARFLNLGPDPVAVGGVGITWAARAIVLQAGDVWVEERGANVAWSAITEAGTTASVTRQEVMA